MKNKEAQENAIWKFVCVGDPFFSLTQPHDIRVKSQLSVEANQSLQHNQSISLIHMQDFQTRQFSVSQKSVSAMYFVQWNKTYF